VDKSSFVKRKYKRRT